MEGLARAGTDAMTAAGAVITAVEGIVRGESAAADGLLDAIAARVQERKGEKRI